MPCARPARHAAAPAQAKMPPRAARRVSCCGRLLLLPAAAAAQAEHWDRPGRPRHAPFRCRLAHPGSIHRTRDPRQSAMTKSASLPARDRSFDRFLARRNGAALSVVDLQRFVHGDALIGAPILRHSSRCAVTSCPGSPSVEARKHRDRNPTLPPRAPPHRAACGSAMQRFIRSSPCGRTHPGCSRRREVVGPARRRGP